MAPALSRPVAVPSGEMLGPAQSLSPLFGSPVKVTVTVPCAAGSATVCVAGTETVCAAAGTARPKSSRSARKPRHGHRMACRTSAAARTKAGSRLLEGEAEGPALKRRPAGAEGSGGEEERPRPCSHRYERRAARLGSARLGSARLGSARLGSARLGSARLGSARLGSARLGSARLGSARLGSARLGSARLGSARLGSSQSFYQGVIRSP